MVKKRTKVKGDSVLSTSSSIPSPIIVSSIYLLAHPRFDRSSLSLSLSPAFVCQWRIAGNEGESFIGKVNPAFVCTIPSNHLHQHPPLSPPSFLLSSFYFNNPSYRLFMRACIFFFPLTSECSSGW